MLRIILDTNVLINGIEDEHSFTNQIVDLCLSGEVQPLISPQIKREYQRLEKRLITDPDYEDRLDEFYNSCEAVQSRSRVRIVEDDPDDNKFFACAKDGRADYIISDDHHLLDVATYKHTKIKTPEEFWNLHQTEFSTSNGEWRDWVKSIGIEA